MRRFQLSRHISRFYLGLMPLASTVDISATYSPSGVYTHRARSLKKTRDTVLRNMSTNKQVLMQAQPPRPNSCTYWVTENLIAGEYPADAAGELATRRKLRHYLDKGITAFVDLTHEGEKPAYSQILMEEAIQMGIDANEIKHTRLPILDMNIPKQERMNEILDSIESAIKEGRKVYVHCRGGIGRTGTAVGCFLVRNGYSGDDALSELNRLFKFSDRSYESYQSPETSDQINFVRNFRTS